MNMLVGVLCEVMSAVAQREKEKLAAAFWKSKILALIEAEGIDQNGDYTISRHEFRTLLKNRDAIQALRDVDVEPLALLDMADLFFQSDSKGQEFEHELD